MAASFAVHPFSFLEKPIQNSKIREVLAEYLQYYGTEEKNYIEYVKLRSKIFWAIGIPVVLAFLGFLLERLFPELFSSIK